ncbi:Spo0E family sporulation regulatory protein-aspartic acid phosphatase [Paenibacillus sp. HJL G12]|uniref:Spo0E family sporulation regulatory protein-aspartic acid phosphatase n=1 Tax=Paenibacillus dendrobii TaxID=2691084 RepID=A0A7X3IHC9_9BACL|nr:aspartyl-phosphate phosphatase Spo0E family protein [Paenibacillus dendrobii]MWV43944.1 Spo0E family sporulation regulatory protein-aspartic acid phosphatase [Paenibacillus dendrobii]
MEETATIQSALKFYLQNEGLTIQQFSRISGINEDMLGRILNGNPSDLMEQLEQITAGMDLIEGWLDKQRHSEQLEEARSTLEQIEKWAAANTYLDLIVSSETQSIPEYIDFISAQEEDVYTVLFKMLQTANRHRINIDDLLDRFASYFPEQKHGFRVAINQQAMSETYVTFLTELAIYQLRQHRCEGIHLILQCLDFSIRINSEINIMECVNVFERFKHQAGWEAKQEFMDLLGKSNMIQFCLEMERQRLYQMVHQYGGMWNPNVIRQSMVLDEIINNYNKLNTERKEKNPI